MVRRVRESVVPPRLVGMTRWIVAALQAGTVDLAAPELGLLVEEHDQDWCTNMARHPAGA